MIDVSDLSEQDLAAVVRVPGAADVADATGLPVGYLAGLVAGDEELDESFGCPRCGSSCTTRYVSEHQRCRFCRREMRRARVDRARNVLACGLTGEEARLHLMQAEGCTEWVARKLLAAARKDLAVAA